MLSAVTILAITRIAQAVEQRHARYEDQSRRNESSCEQHCLSLAKPEHVLRRQSMT
jgi:hypothetical protein